MTTFTIESKRAKAGQTLEELENQANMIINELKRLKSEIITLKTSVKNDADYDATDEAEVQIVIDSLVASISNI